MPNPDNYSFPIVIKSGSRYYHMIVEQVYLGATVERYRIMARDNPDKFIEIENNRPLIRQKYMLRKKALTWKVRIGNPKNLHSLEEVIRQIELNIDPPERSEHPKNS